MLCKLELISYSQSHDELAAISLAGDKLSLAFNLKAFLGRELSKTEIFPSRNSNCGGQIKELKLLELI